MGENIFLFVPNLIGYARIFLALVSFYFMPTNYVLATVCYITSGLLDAFDGHAARILNQSTKFGAILDQLTDRCATLCLLMVLSCFYPKYMFFFQLSALIDIAGHWIHVWVSLMQGKTSHKFVDVAGNPVMKLYYTSRPVLFGFCAGNELFYAMLYLLYFVEGPTVFGIGLFRLIMYVTAPVSLFKTGITLLHMYLAGYNVGMIDVLDRRQEIDKTKEQ